MVLFHKAFSAKRFVCCALTIVYSMYNMVGWSIASIYDLDGIFTSELRASVIMSPRVVYFGYRPPYCTIYITYKRIVTTQQYHLPCFTARQLCICCNLWNLIHAAHLTPPCAHITKQGSHECNIIMPWTYGYTIQLLGFFNREFFQYIIICITFYTTLYIQSSFIHNCLWTIHYKHNPLRNVWLCLVYCTCIVTVWFQHNLRRFCCYGCDFAWCRSRNYSNMPPLHRSKLVCRENSPIHVEISQGFKNDMLWGIPHKDSSKVMCISYHSLVSGVTK